MKENKRASKAAAHKKRIEELHKLLMEGKFSLVGKKSPAFQLYIADFLIGTMHMHINSVGPYIVILCYQWDKGFLPNDRKEICKIGRCNEEMLDEFYNKFKSCKDGKLRNNRLEEIRAEQIANKERASAAGINGNNSRWGEVEEDQEPEQESKSETLPKVELTPGTDIDFFYIGTETYKMAVSKFMRENMQIFLEAWKMKNQQQNIDAVLKEMDKKVGHPYTSEVHIQNAFSKIARDMLRDKPKGESNQAPVKASTNYGKKKQ